MSEFLLDIPAWQEALEAWRPDTRIDAMQLLALMEGEPEDAVQAAFAILEQRHIILDIESLPKEPMEGETGARLALEQKLVKSGALLTSLEQSDPLYVYLQELAAIPTTGNWQILLEKFQAGDANAAPALADCMLTYVMEEACRLTGRSVLLLDLIQEGNLGLWQSILSYESGDFVEHCRWYIRQYLAYAIFMQARSSGIGQKLRQGMEDYRNADMQLLGELGRNPTMEEIAEQMHVSMEDAEVFDTMVKNARLRQQVQQPPEPEPQEEELAVEDTAYFQSRQRIQDMLSLLTDDEAKVLTLRFGLEGGIPKTPREVGAFMRMTAEEVVAMEAAALQKLRQN